MDRCQSTLENQAAVLRDLERQHREAGGDQIEQWEAEKSGLERQRTERLHKRDQAENACKKLGWSLPDSPQAFAEILGNARREVENWEQCSNDSRAKQFRLDREKKDAEIALSQALKEVQALQRQPSNIPANMLEMRRDIAAAIGISESALPFVGELVEVKPDEAEWQGAIERLLHGFALSLLVDERQYSALVNHSNNTHLGQHLVYHRTVCPEKWQAKPVGANSLVLKLNVKEGAYANWLLAELRQNFDYACVDSIQSFRVANHAAITREGQVKHNKTWHEKDDRRSVGDRRNWALGFDNREKLGIFLAQVQEQKDAIARLDGEIEKLSAQDKNRAARAMQCQTLVNLQWQEIDMVPLLERISTLERQIREAREENAALLQISGQIGKQKKLVADAENALRQKTRKHDSVIDQIAASAQKLQSLQKDASIIPLTQHQVSGLDERFAGWSDAIRLDNLDKVATAVFRSLCLKVP